MTGFAGGFLAQHLVDCGDEVLGTSRGGEWSSSRRDDVPRQVPLVPWDLGRPDGLRPAARREIDEFAPQCIYHLAAISVPEDCGRDVPTPEAVAINVEGTRRVLELAAELPGRVRVLVTSTSRVYAPVADAAARLSEDAPVGPRTAYGRTKLEAEKVAQQTTQGGVDVVIARSFQHAGPGQDPRLMLSDWASQFARGSSSPVTIRCRDAYIDLTDVRDTVRAYRLLVERGEAGGLYNVGSGTVRRSGELFDIMHAAADPGRKVVELRPGPIYDPIADPTRLVSTTSWRPEIALEQTIADTLAYWRRRYGSRGPGENEERKI